jgi:hypothetical protein
MKIYDYNESRFIPGVFRTVRDLDSGAQLGYFESTECANRLTIMVLYPDGTYSVAERLDGMLGRKGTAGPACEKERRET